MPTKTYDDTQITCDTAGNVVAGVSFWIYDAKTAGTRLTSTLRDGDGNAVTNGTIVSDSQGYHPFQETSGAYTTLWRQPLDSGGAPTGRRFPIDPLGGGSGGGSVDTGTAYTWTAAQNFSAGISVPDNALTIADVSGLQLALDARVNPSFKGDIANQTAMLGLTANVGDYCWRTDTGTMWFLVTAGAATLGNWREAKDAGARNRANHTGTQDLLSTITGPVVAHSENSAALPVGADGNPAGSNVAVLFFTSTQPTAIPAGPAAQITPNS